MKLWLISQTVNNAYDTYDAAVVAAETEEEARLMNPEGEWGGDDGFFSWCRRPEQVTVKYIGEAAEGIEAGFILKSFNAG